MLRKDVQIQRPERWDIPFDEGLSARDVDQLLTTEPFASMDADRFPARCSLRGILQNDTRLIEAKPGDIIVREGDYGNSAFLMLSGAVRVTLERLSEELLGRSSPKRNTLKTLWRMIFRPKFPEFRSSVTSSSSELGSRSSGASTRVFLQDVPAVLDTNRTIKLESGHVFGELAALSRTPRTATVFAEEPSLLLEIRWQGLRDLMRFDDALRDHIHDLYRQNSLASHLRATPFLQHLDDGELESLVAHTQFETYGDFEWHRPYKRLSESNAADRIESEPLIAQEGNSANGLLLIRNGFARISQHYGNGQRTVSYLGKGQTFGLEELYLEWASGKSVPLRYSIRAVGYVDVLRIPAQHVEQHVLPRLSKSQQAELKSTYLATRPRESTPAEIEDLQRQFEKDELETGMLEFIVENRFTNGTQTMMINLDRCTRCDDCVRACSDTHDNNPRFVREGPVFGRHMFASACMHCVDPVCMIGCPTGAISRNEETGNVTIHDGSCIGCATCANSCPYQSIRMVEIRNGKGEFMIDMSTQMPISKATKCDLCTDSFGGPACQRACPHDALVRIDLRNPDELKKLLAR